MKIKVSLIFLLAIVSLSCDSIFNSNPKSKEFEYYKPGYSLTSDSKLKTEGFYASPGNTNDLGAYNYLKFYKDGFVLHFGGTSMVPDTLNQNRYLEIKRKKNGEPVDTKNNWGYFTCFDDSLKFTIIKHRGMSSIMHKYVGVIVEDTLFFQVYKESIGEQGKMYKNGEEKYVYYEVK